MSDFAARTVAVCGSTIETLHEQYALIGLGSEEVSMLLTQLESELAARCHAQVEEARSAVAALHAEIATQGQTIAALRTQLGINDQPLTQPTGTLQAMKSAHAATIASLMEQKALHLSALTGDLKRLQQVLYPKLDISREEVPEFVCEVDAATDDLSTRRLKSVEAEVSRVESLWAARNATITGLISEMSASWSRLGNTPEDVATSFDTMLFESADNAQAQTLEPTASVIAQLKERQAELGRTETKRRGDIDAKKTVIATLHKRLATSPDALKQFEAQCAHHATSAHPLSLNVIGFYSTEAARLDVLKQAKLQSLVFEVRVKLSAVYKELHLSQSEQCAFKPLQSTVFTDAVLEAHEAELARAESRLASLQPILKEIAKWTSMKEELATFELSSADPTRFQARNAHVILKHEEKMRKKRDVAFPALESRLLELLDAWQADHVEDGESGVPKMDGVSVAELVRASVAAREDKGKKKSLVDGKTISLAAGTPAKAAPASVSATPRQSSASAIGATPAKAISAAAVATPAKVAATPLKARVNLSTPAATPMRPATAEKERPVATPRVMSTPLRKQPTSLAAALSTPAPVQSSPAPAAAAASPAAPIVRPTVNSRIPAFGTTSSVLTSVTPTATAAAAATARRSKENPTPAVPTAMVAPRAALGELRAPQNVQTIPEEALPLKKPAAAAAATKMSPIPIESESNTVEDETNRSSIGGANKAAATGFMARFQTRLASCASESEQLEVFLGPFGLGAQPAPPPQMLAQLLRQRAALYAGFDTAEDARLADTDIARADAIERKLRVRDENESGILA